METDQFGCPIDDFSVFNKTWYRGTMILDRIVVRRPATVTLFLYSHSQNLAICDSVHICSAMNLSATNLWFQVALISSPAVHSYGEDHSLSSQVWQMPFRSQ